MSPSRTLLEQVFVRCLRQECSSYARWTVITRTTTLSFCDKHEPKADIIKEYEKNSGWKVERRPGGILQFRNEAEAVIGELWL